MGAPNIVPNASSSKALSEGKLLGDVKVSSDDSSISASGLGLPWPTTGRGGTSWLADSLIRWTKALRLPRVNRPPISCALRAATRSRSQPGSFSPVEERSDTLRTLGRPQKISVYGVYASTARAREHPMFAAIRHTPSVCRSKKQTFWRKVFKVNPASLDQSELPWSARLP